MQTYSPEILQGRRVGIEKESLRVAASGAISQTDHPESLGAALTHPSITTDFSEALLELVTPPCDSSQSALDYLSRLHQYVDRRLPMGETIWNTSMPCILSGGQSVRIGEYGTSFSGKMKHCYRRGLALRYGRRMQAIAGIHFNYSLPEPVWLLSTSTALPAAVPETASKLESQWLALSASEQMQLRTHGYFSMVQNLLRIGWIIPYLFGASPAVCASFLGDKEGEELEIWNTSTRYAPYGTSLRMGEFGYRYREDQPIDLNVRHTSIHEYIKDIISHVSSEHPPYSALGVFDESGQRQQLNACRLQIENEFYSSVRPKQIPEPGELPIQALKQRGIRYLELRSVDVNLFEPAGIGLNDLLMLEMLMLFAWLSPVKPLNQSEMNVLTGNIRLVAHRGREPGLELTDAHGPIELTQWGKTILDLLQPISQWMDKGESQGPYQDALQHQRLKFENSAMTPSAEMLEGIKSTGSFFDFVQQRSREHHVHYESLAEDESFLNVMEQRRTESFERQQQLERDSKGGDFDLFLSSYLNQIKPDTSHTV
ncbi:MAG: glutamate--cysteine ligase [Granulosicoccus sp.]|nr:glutamate--cysteine ligase [Granulosicoccus sp.]